MVALVITQRTETYQGDRETQSDLLDCLRQERNISPSLYLFTFRIGK